MYLIAHRNCPCVAHWRLKCLIAQARCTYVLLNKRRIFAREYCANESRNRTFSGNPLTTKRHQSTRVAAAVTILCEMYLHVTLSPGRLSSYVSSSVCLQWKTGANLLYTCVVDTLLSCMGAVYTHARVSCMYVGRSTKGTKMSQSNGIINARRAFPESMKRVVVYTYVRKSLSPQDPHDHVVVRPTPSALFNAGTE